MIKDTLCFIFLFANINLVFAEDILLDKSIPVSDDPTLIVETYYRNQPNYYYFTIVYRNETVFEKYFSKVRFTDEGAMYQHKVSVHWARSTYYGCLEQNIDMPIEKRIVVYFNPKPTQYEEIYIIHPNRD